MELAQVQVQLWEHAEREFSLCSNSGVGELGAHWCHEHIKEMVKHEPCGIGDTWPEDIKDQAAQSTSAPVSFEAGAGPLQTPAAG